MSETKMAVVENLKTSNRGYELNCEFRNYPVTFVNALRRLVLSGVPTVAVRDVQILENTSQLPHEMLRHRVEMLPVNVNPEDASTVRDAKIELRILPEKTDKIRTITTDDFVVESGRDKILMRDRDLNTPLLFLRLRSGEAVHLRGRLSVETQHVSQVCVGTTRWHVDPERVKLDRKMWVDEGKDPVLFDNFYYQQSFSRDESNRPNWIDMQIESIGVLSAKDILKYAVAILRKRLETYMKEAMENIARDSESGSYTVTLEQGGHTLGALLQEVIYGDKNVEFVSYDIPHPLRNTMVLRFFTKKSPETVLRTAADTIFEYCSTVENVL
jgi:DNA-directed RNA polymerase subunit L